MIQRLKSSVSNTLGRVAMTGALDRFEGPILGLTSRLLDPAVIPPVATPRRLRGLPVEVPCNPHNPFHRSVFWFGRLHERGLDDLLRRFLRPGDSLIDVGANFGHVAFLGSALVGPSGRVHAFEPNPQLASFLADFASGRGLANVAIHGLALGAAEGEFPLRVNPDHLGASTLRDLDADGLAYFSIEHLVKVVRGDGLLGPDDCPGDVFLKIDVEGNEPAVIEGMAELIRQSVKGISMEVTPEWQGGPEGVEAMIGRLEGMGFHAYLYGEPGEPFLTPLRDASAIASQTNVALLRTDAEDRVLGNRRRP